jgi:hypothetical protein
MASGYRGAIVALMSPEPIRDFIISSHARFQMERRGVSDGVVRQVLGSPEQGFQTRRGRVVLHSRALLGAPGTMYLEQVLEGGPVRILTTG